MLKRWITLALTAAVTSLVPILFGIGAPTIAATTATPTAGQEIYNANCSAWHNVNGTGTPASFRRSRAMQW